MRNIDYLHLASKNLSAKELDNLDHMLVGALSVYIEKILWQKIVNMHVAEVKSERNRNESIGSETE